MFSKRNLRDFRGLSVMILGIAVASMVVSCALPPSPAQRCVNMGVPPDGPAFAECVMTQQMLDQQAYAIQANYSAQMLGVAASTVPQPPVMIYAPYQTSPTIIVPFQNR